MKYPRIAKATEKIMAEHGGNKAEVARALNTDATSVAHWLSGNRFPQKPDTLSAIARASGDKLDYLTGFTPTVTEVKERLEGYGFAVTDGHSRNDNQPKHKIKISASRAKMMEAVKRISDHITPTFYPRIDEAIMAAIQKMTAREVIDVLAYCQDILDKKKEDQP